MRDRPLLVLSTMISLAISACSGGNDTGTGGSGGATTTSTTSGTGGSGGASGLPCDVDAILKSHCQSCHGASPVYGAPMPLVTSADLHAPLKSDASKMVYEQISTRIHDAKTPMPPQPNAPLSDADAATIDAWVSAGAPDGSADCGGGGTGGTGGAGGAPGLSCTPDLKLQPAAPYEMPQATADAYMCYGVDVSFGQKRHAIALAPLIDNPTIVHHILLFTAKSSYSSTPKPCGNAAMGQLIGVWAPGGQALELPAEAGYPLDGDTHFVLQVHYSNLMHLDGQKDSTGYQICTTDALRPNDADILAFGTWTIDVPAQGTSDVTCDLKVPAVLPTMHGIAAMPHMHQLGTAISTVNHPADGGADIDLGKADPWNFQSQAWQILDPKTALIQGNDTISTRCAWQNPTNKDVHFGETTSDEMCFGFLMYYPRIAASGFEWGTPAASSTCSPTP
ncbi:MAG: peptidylglycine alpha-amidating monooxygenase [Polyangiaceae bacterium]